MRVLVAIGLGLLIVVQLSAQGGIHRFVPTQFYNTFSHAHPPALRIKPGDRVITTTLDASGADKDGTQVAPGPNPQTGPFFVEGAEPGDALVVTIEKIEFNRATGYSLSVLAPYAGDPAALGQREIEPRRVVWDIDTARGVARTQPAADISPAIEVPLRAMLGCLGVAPARKEAVSTATPGAFGGNMDYAGLNAGVTVTLPVNEPGALLFLGDGHGKQGEGEVVGTGVETSMNVEFTVQLIKQKVVRWPRLENETHIMVLGSARPLLQALQHATTEMQRWLMVDYGYSERAASLLMGQALEYEVANVVDPNFTMVAKIHKSLLPARGQ